MSDTIDRILDYVETMYAVTPSDLLADNDDRCKQFAKLEVLAEIRELILKGVPSNGTR